MLPKPIWGMAPVTRLRVGRRWPRANFVASSSSLRGFVAPCSFKLWMNQNAGDALRR
jgi:hypothetical protein